MAYIWQSRDAGTYNWVAGTLENLAPAAKFEDGETRGDGVLGTLAVAGQVVITTQKDSWSSK